MRYIILGECGGCRHEAQYISDVGQRGHLAGLGDAAHLCQKCQDIKHFVRVRRIIKVLEE